MQRWALDGTRAVPNDNGQWVLAEDARKQVSALSDLLVQADVLMRT